MQNRILFSGKLFLLLISLCFYQCKSSNKSQSGKSKPIVINPLALHRTVAIIPANVNVALNSKAKDNISAQDLMSIKETSAYTIQEKFYNFYVTYSKSKKYYVSCQSIYTTNGKLKSAGIKYEDLYSTDRIELCKILNVDAVIQISTSSEQFMSDGAAIVRSFLLMSSKNKEAAGLISIVDGKSGNTVWSFEEKVKGKRSSSSKLVDDVLRACAARVPYRNGMLKRNNQIIE